QLLGKTLSGYPSLDERKASTATVLEIAGQLRDVFEASNYLLAIGQHALAVGGYEYILQYYQGIEIYNNLGVACALSAQEFWNPATDNYAYPLETDWNSKLERAASRGQEQLDPGMEPFRAAYLDKAESHFRSAIRLQSNYRAAHTNLVCVLNLKAQAAAALQHAERFLLRDINRRRKRPQQELELAEIALGISYALLGGPRRPQAEAIFQRLANASHPAAALYASENLQYLRGEHRQPAPSSMTLPASLRQTLRSAQLGRTSQFERIRLSEKSGLHFARQHNGSGATFVFSNERGNLVSLIRLPVDAFAGARISAAGVDLARSGYKNLVAATEGFFIHNTAEKSVLRVDADGRVLDAVKYLIH
ncbi:MAG: hypothetical protein JNK89_03660, partial [Saprospiraceae bacterium]|nr:hypothetical protein [Saprospiraceae bacterium]